MAPPALRGHEDILGGLDARLAPATPACCLALAPAVWLCRISWGINTESAVSTTHRHLGTGLAGLLPKLTTGLCLSLDLCVQNKAACDARLKGMARLHFTQVGSSIYGGSETEP